MSIEKILRLKKGLLPAFKHMKLSSKRPNTASVKNDNGIQKHRAQPNIVKNYCNKNDPQLKQPRDHEVRNKLPLPAIDMTASCHLSHSWFTFILPVNGGRELADFGSFV